MWRGWCAVAALARYVRRHPDELAPPPQDAPPLSALNHEQVLPGAQAFAGPTGLVAWEAAVGEVAAESIAPAPPGIPRLIPGQRITPEHVRWLVANRAAGMFVLDPVDERQAQLRVVV